MKSDPDIAARALARIVAEVRAEAPPELDWDRIEARLGEEPRLPLVDAPPARAVRVGWLLCAAGVALLAGWFAAGGRGPAPTPTALEAPPAPLNGNLLAAGSAVDAESGDVSVEHSGHSRWTLARGSHATVTRHDGIVEVVLDRGSISAHVVPSPRSETFVVDAAGTRVAVHGTTFSVALTAEEVEVNVTEGTVLVGPRQTPGSGRPVTAHESSHFTLGGAPIATERARAPVSRPPSDHRGAPSLERPRELPAQPSIDEVEKAVSQVLDLSSTCFESKTVTANGVRVTASTTATLEARPNGALELSNLDPPLSPAVQSCIAEGVRSVVVAESLNGISIVRRMDLER